MVPHSQLIYSIGKCYFYDEWFDVLEPCDEVGNLLGYYSDIVTPLQKIGDKYFITDLMLDLWIAPDGTVRELDWDEFEAASASGLIPATLQEKAVNAMQKLRAEVAQGIFPFAYIR